MPKVTGGADVIRIGREALDAMSAVDCSKEEYKNALEEHLDEVQSRVDAVREELRQEASDEG